MDLTKIEVVLGILVVISGFIVFIINKIVNSLKHEDMQDNEISRHEEKIVLLLSKVDNLEEREKNRDLAILEIKTEMQHTQTMIQHLGENHQESFIKLIGLIEKMDENRSK